MERWFPCFGSTGKLRVDCNSRCRIELNFEWADSGRGGSKVPPDFERKLVVAPFLAECS